MLSDRRGYRQQISSFVVFVVLLLVAVPGFAEQRLVRVLWDVGRKVVYVQVNDRTKAGHDGFSVPATEDAARTAGFNKYESYAVLKKDDRVRLYVVNYNPIAHVWHESSTSEVIAPEPSALAAILRATVTGVTGGMTFPAVGFSMRVSSLGVAMKADDPCGALREPLVALVDAGSTLDQTADKVTTLATSLKLSADAKKATEIPTQPEFWNTFDGKAAWDLIRDNPNVFGIDFASKYSELAKLLSEAETAVVTANSKLIAFDRASTSFAATHPTVECSSQMKHRETVHAFMRGVTAEDSALSQVATKYASTKKLLDGYARRLTTSDWTTDAVEVVVKEPVVDDGALRVDAVFVSPDKLFTARTQRSLVLKVETHFPVLTISTGVAVHGFKFKTLAVTQEPQTGSDGAVAAGSRIGIVDDPDWDKFVPVWIENFRLFGRGHAGLYFSFGTTPDRNIFKNGIAGLSLVVPKWRASFTGGIIAARGYEEKDLEPLVTKFSDGAGFAIKGAALATLPLEEPKWKQAGYFSISFMLVSF